MFEAAPSAASDVTPSLSSGIVAVQARPREPLYFKRARMRFEQAAHDGKPHAHPVLFGGSSDLPDLRELLVAQRRSVVADNSTGVLAVPADLKGHARVPNVRDGRQRVFEQVVEHKLDLGDVGLHERARRQVCPDRCRILAVSVKHAAGALGQIRAHEMPALVAGVAAHKVDHLGGSHARLLDFGERLDEHLAGHVAAQQAASEAARIVVDDGQGLLELVRGHARKSAHGTELFHGSEL